MYSKNSIPGGLVEKYEVLSGVEVQSSVLNIKRWIQFCDLRKKRVIIEK